ncbi:hypothetical protein FQA47_018082 [Oryzias melastigma]|uniref:Uncharacterized protein n=1 Tax=Oryzias melastigma TaxID=30732 RepID=A0A834C7F9_ORYME|nr:hypothetical protein FQA47_018082 [Oryzias melastigma]
MKRRFPFFNRCLAPGSTPPVPTPTCEAIIHGICELKELSWQKAEDIYLKGQRYHPRHRCSASHNFKTQNKKPRHGSSKSGTLWTSWELLTPQGFHRRCSSVSCWPPCFLFPVSADAAAV